MNQTEPLIRNISDTARWVAAFRAQETARKDALFQDPLADRMAGERGHAIAKRLHKNSWAFVARTLEFDAAIERGIAAGADTVVNLAAGLDTRPYRMNVPSTLRWFEIDLSEILAEKDRALAGERANCRVERLHLNLADVTARRAAFARIAANSKRTLIVSEGLLVYLKEEQVISLARELAAVPVFREWALDLCSPPLLRMLQKSYSRELVHANAPMHFGPASGPAFFEPLGWKPTYARSLLHTAAANHRLSLFMRLFAMLPDSKGTNSRRPWGGVCVLER